SPCIGGKTAAADRTTTMRNARDRMQMSGDLAVLPGRQMTEGERAERERDGETAADILRRFRIVIAGDPDPVAAALKRGKFRAVTVREPRRAAAVMEAIAKRNDATRRITRDQL